LNFKKCCHQPLPDDIYPIVSFGYRLTEVLLDGILDDVCEELDTLFTDIANKVVGKI